MVRRAPIAAVSAAFGAMLWWTWGTWPDLLVDFGRELYAPWQISLGRVLYRDIAWLSGPLSTYVNAGWFGVFGVHLHTLVFANITLLILTLWLIFKIVAVVACRVSATLAAITCVVMCGFTISNYNFVAPYSHELTHGLTLSLTAIVCFSAFLKTGRLLAIAGAGVAIGLVFLTKAEVFLAVAAAIVAGVGAMFWSGIVPRGRRMRVILTLAASAALPVAIVAALFWRVMPAVEAAGAAGGAWRYVFTTGLTESLYYQRIAGLIDPVESVTAMLGATALYLLVFGAAALACLVSAKHLRDPVLSAGLALALGMGIFGLGAATIAWDQAARALPVLMIVLLAVIGTSMARASSTPPDGWNRSVLRLTVITFALVLLARMALNAAFYRYGFVLALPATSMLIALLVSWIPEKLTASGADGQAFRVFAFAGWFMVMAAHLHGASAYLAGKQHTVSSGMDAFAADSRALVVNDVIDVIRQRAGPEETLAVLPEGVMLNYLSRRTNPTPFVTFMPPELTAYGEARMLAALQRNPPNYIALVHKDTSEYGVRFFGTDYGREFLDWVKTSYRAVSVFGAPPLEDERFGISLLQRMHTP